jgi:hypothetical protein
MDPQAHKTAPLNIDAKLATCDETWRPKIVARLSGQEVKVVKIHGTFP